jgi:hypothetical protein
MGEKEPFNNDSVSHSMCPECYDYYKEQIKGLSLDKFLDKFETPVFIRKDWLACTDSNRKCKLMR